MDDGVAKRIADGVARAVLERIPGIGLEIGLESEYDSPIEFILATAMHFLSRATEGEWVVYQARGLTFQECEAAFLASPERAHGYYATAVFPQVRIGRYRVDFLVIFGTGGRNSEVQSIVVECDGHDFHERTKEQAAADRSRDRDLQYWDYKVLRFTGSEIHRDPVGCAFEVMRMVRDIQGQTTLKEMRLRDMIDDMIAKQVAASGEAAAPAGPEDAA